MYLKKNDWIFSELLILGLWVSQYRCLTLDTGKMGVYSSYTLHYAVRRAAL